VFVDNERVFDDDHRPIRARQLYVRKSIKPIELSFCRVDHSYAYQISNEHLPYKYIASRHGFVSGQGASFVPGGWGQLIMVDCSEEYKGLKRFALGFDFDFNPVCILEDSSVDSYGLIEKQDNPPAWSHCFPDNFKWNDIQEGRAYRPEDHDGV